MDALPHWWTGLADHPDLAWRGLDTAIDVRDSFLPATGSRRVVTAPHLATYRDQLEAIARRWGLRAPWAAPWLHAAMLLPAYVGRFGGQLDEIDLRRRLRSYGGWAAAKTTIRVSVEMQEWEGWEDVRERLLALAKPQFDRLRAQTDASGDWVRGRRKPERAKHIEWLYRRMCSQASSKPQGWRCIAREYGVSYLAVRNAVLALADELDIDLPRLAGGRPRRTSYQTSAVRSC